LISVVPHFLEPNGYCERILFLWSGSIAGLTVTTGLSVTGRRRQRLTATAPCSAAIPRISVETRTRGEAYADLRQIVETR